MEATSLIKPTIMGPLSTLISIQSSTIDICGSGDGLTTYQGTRKPSGGLLLTTNLEQKLCLTLFGERYIKLLNNELEVLILYFTI